MPEVRAVEKTNWSFIWDRVGTAEGFSVRTRRKSMVKNRQSPGCCALNLLMEVKR